MALPRMLAWPLCLWLAAFAAHAQADDNALSVSLTARTGGALSVTWAISPQWLETHASIAGFNVSLNDTLVAQVPATTTAYDVYGLSNNTVYAVVVGVNWLTPSNETLVSNELVVSTLNATNPSAPPAPLVVAAATLSHSVSDSEFTFFGLDAKTSYRLRSYVTNAADLSSDQSVALSADTLAVQLPGPCPPPTVLNVTGGSILLRLNPPNDDGGARILGYIVFIAMNGSSRFDEIANTVGATHPNILNVRRLSGPSNQLLRPLTQYDVRAIAVNVVDACINQASLWNVTGEVLSVVTAKASLPDAPPAPYFLSATGGTATVQLLVSANLHGSVLSGFSVMVDGVVYGTLTASDERSYSIGYLRANTTYSVQVATTTDVGTSEWSLPLLVTTGDASRPSSPLNVSATDVGSSQALVQWSKPLDSGGLDITKYRMTLFSPLGMDTISAPGSSTSYRLKGLIAETTYTVKVIAMNEISLESSASKVKGATFQTLSPTFASVPSGIAALTATGGAIEVAWQVPDESGGTAYDGLIYNVSMFRIAPCFTNGSDSNMSNCATCDVARLPSGDDRFAPDRSCEQPSAPSCPDGSRSCCVTSRSSPLGGGQLCSRVAGRNRFRLVLGGATVTSFQQLNHSTTYYFAVQVLNSAGRSPFSPIVGLRTSSQTAPGYPSNILQIGGAGGSVMLTWDAPKDSGGTAIVGYRVYRDYRLLTPQPVYPPYLDCGNGLLASTQYLYNVAAVNASRLEGRLGSVLVVTPPVSAPQQVLSMSLVTRTISWLNVTVATGCDRGGSSAMSYQFLVVRDEVPIASGFFACCQFLLTGLEAGQAHQVSVRIANEAATLDWVNRTFTTTSGIPATPALELQRANSHSLVLSAAFHDGLPDREIIAYDIAAYQEGNLVQGSTFPCDSIIGPGLRECPSTFRIGGLSPKTLYQIASRAVGPKGLSDWSSQSFTTSDESSGSLEFVSQAYAANNGGTANITVRRANGTAGSLSVVLNVSQPETVTLQCDCFFGEGCSCVLGLVSSGATSRPGILTFLDGQDTQTIEVSVWEDDPRVVEPMAVVLALLGSAAGVVGMQSQAVLQLSPSQRTGHPSFTRSEVDVLENSSYAKINIVRLNGSSGAIALDVETFDILSTAFKHYIPLSQTIQMADRQSLSTLWVRLIDNRYYEGTRVFGVRLREHAVANSSGGLTTSRQRSVSTRRIRIIDDEDPSMLLPATPVGLNASRVTGGEIELVWQAPNATTVPTSGYMIRVSTPSNGTDVFNIYNTSSVATFILSSLQPTTLYRFQVAAWNAYGISEFSTTNLALTTGPSPPSAPLNLRANITGSSFIVLAWDAPRDLGGSSRVDFEVMIQGDDGDFRLLVEISDEVMAYMVEGLSALTPYSFSITASTSAFPASSSSNGVANFTAWTGTPTAPAKPPPLLLMRPPTGGTLTFLIQDPRDLGGTVIVDYSLYLRKVTGQDGGVPSNMTNTSSSTNSTEQPFQIVCSNATPKANASSARSCTVYKLLSATDYEAFVVLHNSVGPSEPSDRIVVRTSSTIDLPSPPENFRAVRVTAGNIYLAWDQPQDLGGTASVIGYTVFQRKNAFFSDSYFIVYDGQDSTERQVTIKGLARGNVYAFAVIAQTATSYCVNLGAQHMSDFINVTTLGSGPLSSPQSLVRVATTGGAITIGWQPPEDLAGVPLYGYTVQLLSDESGSDSQNISPEMLHAGMTQFTHFGLAEQTVYHFAVTAMNQDGPGERSAVVSISTEPCSPPQGIVNGQVVDVSGGRISISWSPPPDSGGRDIQYYQVTRADQQNKVMSVSSSSFNDTSGLMAQSQYLYSIRAFNGLYFGQMGYVWASTGAPTVSDPPIPTTTVSFGGRVEVAWASAQDTGGVRVMAYEVTLLDGNGSTSLNSFTGIETTYTFTSLTANTQYVLQLLAVNEVGRGPVARYEIATSDVDLPSAPPPPTASEILGGSMWITVYLPSYTGGGDVTLLLLEGSTVLRTFTQGQVSTLVSGLVTRTQYRFRAAASNARGQALSDELVVSTAAISAPSAVSSVELVEATFDRLSLAWPPVEDTGGDVALQYKVSYFACDTSGAALASGSTVIVTTSFPRAVLANLDHATSYSITVQAWTSTGLYGGASPNTVFTTEEPFMGRILVQLLDIFIEEGNPTVSIPLIRVEGSFGETSFTYQVVDETAFAGVNYDALGSEGSMPSGVKNGSIVIALRDDDLYNPNMTFLVQVRDVPSNALTQTRVTILDDGDAGVVSFSAAQFHLLENARVAYLPITRNGGSSPLAVLEPYIISARTALDSRFTLMDATLTFAEGETIQDLTVQIEDDSAFQYWPDTVVIGFRVLEGGVWVGDIGSANLTAVDDGDVSPPKEITGLKLGSVTGGAVQLLWSAPLDQGGVDVDLWYLVQVLSSDSVNGSIMVDTTVSSTSTTVYGLSALTTYQVVVRVGNTAGVGRASGRLLVSTTKVTPPTAPMGVSLLVFSSSSLLLSWNPPLDTGGSTIVGYTLYNVLGNGSLTLFPYVECSLPTMCLIKRLVALTTYSIQVRANTAAVTGTGELSAIVSFPTSNPDVPDPPPVANVTWVSAGAMTIQMFVPMNVGGSDVQQYRLFIRGPTDGDFVFKYQGTANAFTVYRLSRLTVYEIKYQVINVVGVSDFGPTLAYQTLERSLVSAPLDLSVVSATGGAVMLQWSEPLDVGGREVSGYTVMMHAPLANTTSIAYDGKGIPVTRGVIYGLVANTTYTLFAIAFTEVSNCFSPTEWSASVPIQASTTFPTLPTPAPSVAVVRVTGGIIELTWRPPLDQGGVPIAGYTVLLISPTGTLPIFSSSGNGPLSFVHNDLIESTVYTYMVQANSTVGDSPLSDPLVVKTLIATAPSAPLNVRQTAYVTGGAIQIGWDRPVDTGGQPLQAFWVYRDGATVAQSLDASVRSFTDTQNLRAATSYVYTVRAVSWSTMGSELSSPISAKTAAASNPQLPLLASNATGASFVSVVWAADLDTGGVPVSLFEAKLMRGSTTVESYVGVNTSFRFTRLAADTTYQFVLVAYNQIGGSNPLSVAFTTLPAIPPDTPLAPVAVGVFGGNITVEVSPPVDTGGANVTGMRLYEATLGFLGNVSLPVGSLKARFTLFGLVKTTDYLITASAVNRLGEGSRSIPLAVRTGPLSHPGVIQTAPNLTAATGTTLSIVWTTPIDTGGNAALSYEIRFVDPSGIVTSGVSVTRSYIGTLLKYFTLYTVSVRVVNAAGKSDWSPPLSARTQPDAAGEFSLDTTAVSVEENAGQVVLNVQRSNGLSGAIAIAYAVILPASNAPTVGVDFALAVGSTRTTSTLTFASLQVNATITILLLDDSLYEYPDEQFTVQLVSATLVQAASIQAPRIGTNASTSVTILDDGDAGYVSFSQANYSVREDAVTFDIPIIREGGKSTRIVLGLTFADGTATGDRDYRRPLSSTLAMEDGQTSAMLRVSIMNDKIYEFPDEFFTITMASVNGGARLRRNVTVITIQDDGDQSVPATPPAPLPVASTGGGATLTLKLPAHNGSATGVLGSYIIRIANATTGDQIFNVTVPIATQASVGRLVAKTAYSVAIAAANTAGASAFSPSVQFSTTSPTLPGPVVNVSIAGSTGGSVQLAWLQPDDTGGVPITKYRIYKINMLTAPELVGEILQPDLRGTVYGLTANTTYRFAVQAGNNVLFPEIANGWGALGQAITVTTPAPTLPGPTRMLKTGPLNPTGGAVSISWSPPLDSGGTPTLEYEVYARNLSTAFSIAALVPQPTSSSASIEGLYASTWYEIFLIAVSSLRSVSLPGLASCSMGSKSLVTTVDLSKRVASGTVVRVGDAIFLVGDTTNATKGTLPLAAVHVGKSVAKQNISAIGMATALVNLSTTSPTIPQVPPPATLVNATGGAIAFRVDSPGDTGGVTIDSFTVLINGEEADEDSVMKQLNATSALTKTLIMRISNLVPQTSIEVTAVAINSISLCDFKTKNTSLVAVFQTSDVTAPEPPQLALQFVTGGGLKFSLLDPFDKGGAKVTRYLLYIATSPAKADWALASSVLIKPTDTKRPSTVVAGLEPQTKYYFRMSVNNGVFESINSSVVSFSTSSISPPGPCEEPLLVAATGGMLSVAWADPLDNGGAPVIDFTVTLQPASATGSQGKRIVRLWKPRSYTFYGLSDETEYSISVKARNEKGAGPDGPVAKFATTEGTPPNGSIQVTTVGSTGGAAILLFNEPLDFGGTRREDMQYNVFVDNDHTLTLTYSDLATSNVISTGGGGGGRRRLGASSASSPGGVVIGGLDPLSLYSIQIQPVNGFATGTVSGATPATTTQATLPSAPRNLQIPTVGGGSVDLTWTVPVDTGGLPLLDYAVYMATNVAGPFAETSCRDQLTGCRVSSLDATTSYWFYVVSTNALGESPPSSVATATTLSLSRPSVPGKISIVSVSDEWIVCEWTAPKDDGGSPITVYTITVNDETNSVSLPVVLSTTTSARISGLSSRTQYSLTVAATNQLSPGDPSVPQFVTTAKAANAPTSPIASCISKSRASLMWYSHPSGTQYRLLRDGTQVYAGTTTHFIDTHLVANTVYSYMVEVQVSGTWTGVPSSPVSVTTLDEASDQGTCTTRTGLVSEQNYEPNASASWLVRPTDTFSTLTLQFTLFDLECDHDVVRIENADDTTLLWQGGCPRTGTFVVQSPTAVRVFLTADASVEKRGFELYYETDLYPVDEAPTRVPPPQSASGSFCSSRGVRQPDGSCKCSVGFTGEGCNNHIVCCTDPARCTHAICSKDPSQVIVVSNEFGDDTSGTGAMMTASERGTATKAVRSLSKALSLARDGDTVFIYPGVYKGVLNRDLLIASRRDLTIQTLKGFAWTLIDCEQRGRVITMTTSSVTLDGLTLQNGVVASEDGGAIQLIDTSLAIQNVLLTSNSAPAANGGAIAATRSSVSTTSVRIEKGTALKGGAVSLRDSQLVLSISNITICRAGHGGAVLMDGASTITADSEASFISKNTATGDGGGVLVAGGTVTVANLQVFENAAARGGGLAAWDANQVMMTRSGVKRNKALLNGGGIALLGAVSLSGNAVDVNDNVAILRGGGMYVEGVRISIAFDPLVGFLRFKANQAVHGAGISVANSRLSLAGVSIESCTASEAGGGVGLVDSVVDLASVTVSSNTASTAGGGLHAVRSTVSVTTPAVVVDSNRALVQGGGLYLLDSSVSGGNIVISHNTAAEQGGGFFAEGAVSLLAVVIRTCTAKQGGGGYLSGATLLAERVQVADCTATNSGGGLAMAASVLNVLSSEIRRGSAVTGGGIHAHGISSISGDLIIGDSMATIMGGAVYATDTLTLSGALIQASTAPRGGGVFVERAGAIATNVTVRSCIATLDGGGWLAQASSLSLQDVRLAEDKSGTTGGGLALLQTDVVHDNTTIVNNSAGTNGGGVSVHDSTLTPSPLNPTTTSRITDNRAQAYGGNVYVEGTGTLAGVEISGGQAVESGGGVAMQHATVAIRESTVNRNHADRTGGGLSLRDGTSCDLLNTTISDNTATVFGGGMSVEDSVIHHGGVMLQRNSAPRGGALACQGISKALPFSVELVSLIDANRATGAPPNVKGDGSAIYLAPQSDTEVAGLQIRAGVAQRGGVFVDGATLELRECEFAGNKASDGAALFATATSVVDITASNFTSNAATLTGGACALDGATTGRATATLTDCVLTDNRAAKAGGAVATSYADVVLIGTHFETNRAGVDGGGGGAIATLTSSNLNASDCTFLNNTVLSDTAKGATLYLLKATTTRLERSLISADKNASVVPREGGAVYLSDKVSTLSMVDCEIAYGQSVSGGAIYVAYATLKLFNSTMRDSHALEFGGSLYVDSGVVEATECTLRTNEAFYDGGGIYVKGETKLTIASSIIQGNHVQDGGGGLYVAAGGGAIVSVTNSSLLGNTNSGLGSAIFVGRKNRLMLAWSNATSNGGPSTEAGALYAVDAQVGIDFSTFTENSATLGGAIVLSRDATLNMTGSDLSGNHATIWGGALYMSVRAVANIKNSTFRNNTATTGGALYLLGSSTLTVQDSSFQQNRARSFGGAITIIGRASANISTSTCNGNSAYTGGVLVVTQNASVALAASAFANNSATDFGGVVYVDSLTPTRDRAVRLLTLETRDNTAKAGSDIYWVFHAWFVLTCESCRSATTRSGTIAIATSPVAITTGWWPKTVTSGVLLGVTKRGWVDPLSLAVPAAPANGSSPVDGGATNLPTLPSPSERRLASSSSSSSSGMDAATLDAIASDPDQTSPYASSLWPTLVVRDYYGAIADQDNRTQCLARKQPSEQDEFNFYPASSVDISRGYVTLEDAQVLADSRPEPFQLVINCTLADDVERNLSVTIQVNNCNPGYENADGRCIPCKKNMYSLDGVKCHACPLGATCEMLDESKTPIGVSLPARAEGYFLHDSRETYQAAFCLEPSSWDDSDPCKNVEGSYVNMTYRLQHCSKTETFTKYWPPKRIFACLSALEYYACDTRDACVEETAQEVQLAATVYELSQRTQCDLGYGSVTCATCQPNFYKVSNGTCRPCSDPTDPNVAKMTRVMAMVPIGFGLVAAILVWIYFSNSAETEIMNQARAASKFQVYDPATQPQSLVRATQFYLRERATGMLARARRSLTRRRQRPLLFQIAPPVVKIPPFRAEKFKILLGFFQIFGGFKKLYEIPWPHEMSRLMDIFSIADFSLVDTTGIECFFHKDYFSNYRLSLFSVLVLLFATMLLLSWGVVRYRVKLASLPRHCVKCGLPVFQMLKREPKTVVRRATMVSLLRTEHRERELRMKRRSLATRAKDKVSTKLEAVITRVGRWWKATRAGRTLEKFLLFVRLPASSSRHYPACPTSQRITSEVLAMVVRSNLRLWRSRVRLRLNYRSFQNKCIKLFFWILLLFYPELSQRAVAMFYCDEIGSKHYMSRDKSQLCYEGTWLYYVPLTLVLLVVWVFGVPVLFWTLLFLKRRSGVDDKIVLLEDPSNYQLKQRLLREMRADLVDRGIHMEPEKLESFEKDLMIEYLRNKRLSEPSMIGQVGFIYHSYRTEFWWFEVWDMVRKLSLNCVVGLLAKTGANRIIAGLIVFLIYLSVMLFYQPFKEQSDSTLAGVTQIQLFITLFCGLLLKMGALHMQDGVVLMLTYIAFVSNMLTMAYAVFSIVYEKVHGARTARRRAREEYRRAIRTHVRKLWLKAFGYALTEVFLLDDAIRPMPFRVIMELARRDREEKKFREMDLQLARSLYVDGEEVADEEDGNLSASQVELELPRPVAKMTPLVVMETPRIGTRDNSSSSGVAVKDAKALNALADDAHAGEAAEIDNQTQKQ